MSIESVVPSNHPILCCPLLPLPLIFPSIKVFSNESVLHIQWPKYWSFSFSITPSSEYSGLISFRIDWFSLFAVQVTVACFIAGLVCIWKASQRIYRPFLRWDGERAYFRSGLSPTLTIRSSQTTREVSSPSGIQPRWLSKLIPFLLMSGPVTFWLSLIFLPGFEYCIKLGWHDDLGLGLGPGAWNPEL